MTDEQIAADVARLEPIVGKTHAEWYAEACQVTPDNPNTTHAEVLWACRTRMVLHVLGRDMGALADAAEELVKACGRLEECGGQRVRDAVDAIEKVMWWKQ